MKEFVEVAQEVDLYHTKPLRAIGGQICKKMLRTMQRNVINARNLPQIFTN